MPDYSLVVVGKLLSVVIVMIRSDLWYRSVTPPSPPDLS